MIRGGAASRRVSWAVRSHVTWGIRREIIWLLGEKQAMETRDWLMRLLHKPGHQCQAQWPAPAAEAVTLAGFARKTLGFADE